MDDKKSLQDKYDPQGQCFGCGPANPRGLQIKSYPENDHVVLRFRPELHHLAFEGAVNGGIIGTLFDCHCNWTAAYHLMKAKGLDVPPPTVTAEYCVRLKRVTPTDTELILRAWPVKIDSDRAEIEAEMEADGVITATGTGTFVAVKEGHPAHRRW